MTDIATAAFAVKDTFYTKARALFDANQVMVSFGISTERRDLNEIVAFLEVRTEQQQGPLSASNRSRDEDIELQVVISVARSGDVDDREVAAIAYGHLRVLEQYVRKTNTTLDNTCMWCFLTSHESFGYTTADRLAQGRLCEIEATFTARVRITG